ncbi:MAG: site-specific integrase [Turicibacter sp.]|nr:site-specific integrase [Turicibacter sp.]
MRVYIRLLLFTGIRASEGVALEWGDIDFAQSKVTISKQVTTEGKIGTTKTETSNRMLKVEARTMEVLKQWRLYQSRAYLKLGKPRPTYLFTSFGGQTPRTGDEVGKAFRVIADKLGLKDVSLHTLRHTHTSHLINAGVPYKQVQERLGHETIKITLDIYSHLSKKSEAQLIDLLTTYDSIR